MNQKKSVWATIAGFLDNDFVRISVNTGFSILLLATSIGFLIAVGDFILQQFNMGFQIDINTFVTSNWAVLFVLLMTFALGAWKSSLTDIQGNSEKLEEQSHRLSELEHTLRNLSHNSVANLRETLSNSSKVDGHYPIASWVTDYYLKATNGFLDSGKFKLYTYAVHSEFFQKVFNNMKSGTTVFATTRVNDNETWKNDENFEAMAAFIEHKQGRIIRIFLCDTVKAPPGFRDNISRQIEAGVECYVVCLQSQKFDGVRNIEKKKRYMTINFESQFFFEVTLAEDDRVRSTEVSKDHTELREAVIDFCQLFDVSDAFEAPNHEDNKEFVSIAKGWAIGA